MFPPMILYLRVGTPERPGIGLWLPLFLVWLILLPIVVLILVITMLVDTALFLADRPYHHYTLLLFRCLGVLGATRGTIVSIHANENVIDFDLV
jgi:small-conductance mechanosensitive channel